MVSLIEFALFAWVGISVIAVVVQLVRIALYKRSTGASTSSAPASQAAAAESPTIDLNERLQASTRVADPAPSVSTNAERGASMSDAPSAAGVAAGAPNISIAVDAPDTPTADTPGIETSDTPAPAATTPTDTTEPSPAAVPAPVAAAPTAPAADQAPAEEASPTLADLLAGVRLPWNLLPTVDQGREPSNDRVVLMTNEGQPGDIGVDVADELERLGFTITPRGDDVAIATRGEHSLGLQIIPEPATATIGDAQRFPNATAESVALDIWIE